MLSQIRRVLMTGTLTAFAICAQTPSSKGWADRAVSDPLNRELPRWLRFGGEYRVRWEGFDNGGFREGDSDGYLLHRVRLNMQLRPTEWLTLFAQGQDARVWGADRIGHLPPYQDTFDLRQAYLELGSDRQAVSLRTGRQEITFGEERLVGASNWANAARTFDAVRLNVAAPGIRLSAFASSVVVTREGNFDQHTQGNNLHGAFATLDRLVPKTKLEPFVFWRVAPRVRAEGGAFGKLDTWTSGVRLSGNVSPRLAYVTEMVLQRGTSATDAVAAWAGHWRIEYALAKSRSQKIRVEYNCATGDRDPRDGRLNTFDVLYPTPHDKYGLADQVGWKNIRHVAAIYELKPEQRWTVQAKFHSWWLANAHDGLYSAPGALVVRDASGLSGRHVGEEVDLQVLWTPGKRVSAGAGVGHLFTGAFLEHATPGAEYTFSYVMVNYTF